MWSEFLNESRSQKKFDNKPVIILGGKHSGKRSLIDSLFDLSKTTIYNKRQNSLTENNKMRLKGLATAIDYAYLNVIDINDPDNRTHAKLEVYMVQEAENPSVYKELANANLLKNAVIIIMLDFTNPWNFIQELQKWVKFIYELQQMAQLPINDLQQMGKTIENFYKKFKQPQFDENGKFKPHMSFNTEQQQEQLSLPLPDGVLTNNIRIPLIICVNKCDLQTQVLRQESTNKMLVILYHLRLLCVKYGGTLIYTSIKNNCNLNLLYQYIIHRGYNFPFRYKPEPLNEEAIFIPFGFDKLTLINDSVVKIDVTRSYNDIIAQPTIKKVTKEEIVVEQDSKYFEKYINQAQSSTSSTTNMSSISQSQKPQQRKQAQVTTFFKNLLQGNTGARRQTVVERTHQQSQRILNAQKQLLKHTNQVLQKKNLQQE